MKIKKLFFVITFMAFLTSCNLESKVEDNPNDQIEISESMDNEKEISTKKVQDDINIETNKLIDYSLINTKDLQGESIEGNLFQGKVTLVNVWGTYCNPCIVEMPELEKINNNYSDENFQVVGLVIDTFIENDENLDKANQIVSRTGVKYINVIPDRVLMEDLLTGMQFIPTTFLLDENGELIGDMVYGARDYNFFEGMIKDYINN